MYIEKILESELSGNIIDICPVGALTSKPYSFTARPWELESYETIDILDSFGSRIKLDVRGRDVMRIQPSLREDLNEDWISDKVRFCYDGLKLQRILQPMIKKSNFFLNCNWTDAIDCIGNIFNKKYSQCNWGRLELIKALKFRFVVFQGSLVDLNTISMVKNFLDKICFFAAHRPKPKHKPIFLYQRPFFFSSDFFDNFIFGSSYKNFSIIDFLILVNLNTRLESPLLNLQIKKIFYRNSLMVCSVGHLTNLGFECFNLGNDLTSLVNILKGRHLICKKFIKSRHPMLLFGEKFFFNKKGYEVFYFFYNFFKQIFKYSAAPKFIFQVLTSSVGLLNNMAVSTNRKFKNISLFQKRSNKRYMCLLLNTDEIEENFKFLQQDYIIYLGHNGDASLNNADLILPTLNYLEKKSTHINTEGRIQVAQYVMDAPTLASEEWIIFVSLFAYVFMPSLHMYYDFKRFYFLFRGKLHYVPLSTFFVCYSFLQKYLRKAKILFTDQNFKQLYFKSNLISSIRYKNKKNYQGFYRNIDFIRHFDNLKKVKLNGVNYVFASNSKNSLVSDPITKASSILALASAKLIEKNF